MRILASMFVNPRDAVERIRRKPVWLVAFAALALLSVAAMISVHPVTVRLALAQIPPTATAADKLDLAKRFDDELFVRSMFLPVRLIVGWYSTALVLFFLSRLWTIREAARFSHILSLEIHSEAFNVLGQLAAAVFPRAAHSAVLAVPLGLDPAAGSAHGSLGFMVLNSVNVFSVLYITFVGFGLSTLFQWHNLKGFISSLIAWCSTTTFNITMIYLLKENLHLNVP